MRRRSTLPALLAVSLVALTGCNNDTTTAEPPSTSTSSSPLVSPSPTASDSASASTGPSETPAALESVGSAEFPVDRLAAASMHKAVLGRNTAETAEERAVVDAWMTYWQAAADTFYLEKETATFRQVARGQARSSIVEYMKRKQAIGHRVVGWALDNVTSVEVDGDTATVRDCTRNNTFSVDQEVEPVSVADPWYDVTGTLQRSQGGWTVTEQKTKALKKSCLP
jgi:hypothetical protein